MNLLFLTPNLPHPPTQGSSIRNWGLISSLSRNHRISLLTFVNQSNIVSNHLSNCCYTVEVTKTPARNMLQRISTMVLSNKPDMSERLSSKEYSMKLHHLLDNQTLDAIHIEGLEMTPYLTQISDYYKNKTNRPLLIYDAHNAETVIQRRALNTDILEPKRWPTALYSIIQLRRIRNLELEACLQADTVICVSNEDSTALKNIIPTLNPVILPNGIFLSDYPESTQRVKISPPVLLFSGKMDYRPNIDAVVWFANEIFPSVQQLHGKAKFLIVGKSPTGRVLKLDKEPGITVTGAVNDMRPYIAAATVCVVPLRMGGGTRFKILEAMALSRPIISTTIGAEGFPVTNGKEIIIADSPEDQIRAIDSLLCQEHTRTHLGKEGRTLVSNQYQWESIVSNMKNVYSSLLSNAN